MRGLHARPEPLGAGDRPARWAQKQAPQRPGGVDGPSRRGITRLRVHPEDRHRRRGQRARPWLAPSSSGRRRPCSTSALARAGSTPSGSSTSWSASTASGRRCADLAGVVVLRHLKAYCRDPTPLESGSFRPALTGCSPPPPALPPSTGCCQAPRQQDRVAPRPRTGRRSHQRLGGHPLPGDKAQNQRLHPLEPAATAATPSSA